MQQWEQFKHDHPAGSVVSGCVTHVAAWGAYVDLGVPFSALLLVPEMEPQQRGKRFPEDYPEVGDTISAYILCYQDEENSDRKGHISLTQRRSKFSRAVPRMVHDSASVADTEHVAAGLAATLRGNDVVALHGDLGAGKTQFARGLVTALGGDPRQVSSPTYVLLHVYATATLSVFHLDAYRVHGGDDFDAIGFDELLDQGGVVVVEWPSRVSDRRPAGRVDVTIETTGEATRTITVDDRRAAG